MPTTQYLIPAGTFSSSTSHPIIENTFNKRTVQVTLSNWLTYRVTMWRPRQYAPNITEWDWRIQLVSGDRAVPRQFNMVYNGFQGQSIIEIPTGDMPVPGTYTGTSRHAVTYSGGSATDPAWYCSMGGGYPSSSNSVTYVTFNHAAGSGADISGGLAQLNLSTCEPIPETIHVYLNGVEQYGPEDWTLMPPDASHATYWIRANGPMDTRILDLLEARYVCKPSA